MCTQHSGSGKNVITKDNLCRQKTPFPERNCRGFGQNEVSQFQFQISTEAMNRNEVAWGRWSLSNWKWATT